MVRAWKNRQLNRRSTKASNAGFSLVELLIAVTILAIIVIPLLHMFVTSTRINVKSRQMLRGTTVAQDIMEGLKAYTLEEVKAQFTPPDGVSGSSYFNPTEGFYVVNAKLIEGGVREITELEVTNPADPMDPDSQIYYFGIKDLNMQGGVYDALIKLDASTYTEAKVNGVGGGAPAADAHDNAFNGAFYAELGSVSEVNGGGDETVTATDSSYHEHKDLNEAVLRDIKQQVEDSGAEFPDDITLEDIIVNRDIHVLIEDASSHDSEGNPQCKATITFTYQCTYDGTNYTSNGNAGSEAGVVQNITRTFSSGNFYLFYYPIYKMGAQIDRIEFEIKNGTTLFAEDRPMLKSITLAKQVRSIVDTEHGVIAPDMSDIDLYNAENNYGLVLNMSIEGNMSSDLIFKSNLRSNMGKTPTGERGEEILSGIIATTGDFYSNTHVKHVSLTGDNVSDKVTNVIYDIEISVYETGAAQHFGEIDFESNPEVHKLASITNLE